MVVEDGASSGGSAEMGRGWATPGGIDQTGVADDMGATGGRGAVSRKMEQRGAPNPMLPPEQRILQEEEVRTPPRKEAHGHWAIGRQNLSYLREGHE